MKKNFLGYSDLKFRKPRECIECSERDLYIEYRSPTIKSKVSLRQINRYIDEFIVFLKKNHNYTDIKLLTKDNLDGYCIHLNKNSSNTEKTIKTKIQVVNKWLDWLVESGNIDEFR